MYITEQEKQLFRQAGRKCAVAAAQGQESARLFLDEWRQQQQRLARPETAHALAQAYFEGMNAVNEGLETGTPARSYTNEMLFRIQVPSPMGHVLRLQESFENAYVQPWTQMGGEHAVCLPGLGITDDNARLLDAWGQRRGVELLKPASGADFLMWPAGLMIAAARIHIRRHNSADLPMRFIAWALSHTHQAEPRRSGLGLVAG